MYVEAAGELWNFCSIPEKRYGILLFPHTVSQTMSLSRVKACEA